MKNGGQTMKKKSIKKVPKKAAKTDKLKHKVGDNIYINSSYYLSHGSDDFTGGLCKISRIKKEKFGDGSIIWIEVEERPGHDYNYEVLLEEQEELKKEFGRRRGYECPDVDMPWIEPGDIVFDSRRGRHIADYSEW